MPTERVIEVPWALSKLPQTGYILDIGACESTYQKMLLQPDRIVYSLDSRDCSSEMVPGIHFIHESIIGNRLPRAFFDAVLILSTMEHIGLGYYEQAPFQSGDVLAIAEVWSLLKPNGRAVFTVPAGRSRITSWYRQYSPEQLHQLFTGWDVEFSYWGYENSTYVEITEDLVENYDYRDGWENGGGASGALAGIVAHKRL